MKSKIITRQFEIFFKRILLSVTIAMIVWVIFKNFNEEFYDIPLIITIFCGLSVYLLMSYQIIRTPFEPYQIKSKNLASSGDIIWQTWVFLSFILTQNLLNILVEKFSPVLFWSIIAFIVMMYILINFPLIGLIIIIISYASVFIFLQPISFDKSLFSLFFLPFMIYMSLKMKNPY